jgi:acetyltransferase-like isoleucine patch superfamily enzyme
MPRMKAALRQLGQAAFNAWGTHLPSHRLRQGWLRRLGATIGRDSAVFMGTTVFGVTGLVIGDRCVIAERCVLDARGGITIEDEVVLASDVHLWTGEHDPQSPDFADRYAPIRLRRHAWLGTRSMVLGGVTVGEGGVAAAAALVTRDVEDFTIVGGVPATVIGQRNRELRYDPTYRPLLL